MRQEAALVLDASNEITQGWYSERVQYACCTVCNVTMALLYGHTSYSQLGDRGGTSLEVVL